MLKIPYLVQYSFVHLIQWYGHYSHFRLCKSFDETLPFTYLFTDNISSQLLNLVDNHNIIRNTNFQIYPGEGHFLEGALEHYYETIEDFLGSCLRTIEKQEEQDFLDNFMAFR